MKKNIILLIALILPILNSAQNLELMLSIEKDEFLIREPITILAELINRENRSINIPDFNDEGGGLNIKLIDLSSGKLLKKNLSPIYAHNVLNINLLPDESAIKAIPIVPIFYGTTSEGEILPYFNYLLPGKYQIILEYKYKKIKYTQRKYYSNQIEFQIKETQNKIDSDLLKSYDSILVLFNTGYPRRRVTEYQLYRSNLKNLLKKYQNSNYRHLVFQELIRNTKSLPNYSFVKEFYSNYFREYPNNFKILFYLRNEERVKDVINESGTKEVLQKSGMINYIKKQSSYVEKINRQMRKIGRLKNKK